MKAIIRFVLVTVACATVLCLLVNLLWDPVVEDPVVDRGIGLWVWGTSALLSVLDAHHQQRRAAKRPKDTDLW